MPIVGGLDIHRKQITFDYLDTATGEVKRGQIAPADRGRTCGPGGAVRGPDDVAFALEGCTGWRYIAEELAAAGVARRTSPSGLIPRSPGAASGTRRPTRRNHGTSGSFWPRAGLPECWIPPSRILECRALLLDVSRSSG